MTIVGSRVVDKLLGTINSRYTRAGDLCERFDRLMLITGTTIRDEVPTYRGCGNAW